MTTAPIWDQAAEIAYLGCVVIAPETLRTVPLEPSAMYNQAHAAALAACRRLFDRGDGLDVLTISREAGSLVQPDDVARWVADTPTSIHAAEYAAIIADRWRRREAVRLAGELVASAHKLAGAVDLAATARGLQCLDRTGSTDLVPVSAYHASVSSMFDDPAARQERLIRTHLDPLDRQLGGGLERGTYTVVAGRPGMSKTGMMVQVAAELARAGGRVAFISLEMSAEAIVRRMACNLARVGWQQYARQAMRNQIPEADLTRVSTALEELHDLGASGHLLITDETRLTTSAAHAMLFRRAEQATFDLVISDHLRLWSDTRHADNEVRWLGELSWSNKQAARELDAAWIEVAQLSRGVEGRQDKIPTLADLRGSGQIEENCDVVIGLYREGYYKPQTERQTVQLHVLKNREGELGMAEMAYLAHCNRYERLAP